MTICLFLDIFSDNLLKLWHHIFQTRRKHLADHPIKFSKVELNLLGKKKQEISKRQTCSLKSENRRGEHLHWIYEKKTIFSCLSYGSHKNVIFFSSLKVIGTFSTNKKSSQKSDFFLMASPFLPPPLMALPIRKELFLWLPLWRCLDNVWRCLL